VSRREKAIARLKSKPKDYTFDEAVALLLSLGFRQCNKGKTSGSAVVFICGVIKIKLHKPHPQKELKGYQVAEILKHLVKERFI